VTRSEALDSQKIVVGIDGSASSIGALEWAATQASLTHGTIEMVVVWDWYKSVGRYVPVLAGLNPERDAEHVLEKALTNFTSQWPDVSVTGRVVQGNPSPILVDASKNATLLVVGSRGHGEFAGMLIGSVSEYCATHAHCSVLVYRDRQL
jgi:nucleotide-binding universal stress UspA family protein